MGPYQNNGSTLPSPMAPEPTQVLAVDGSKRRAQAVTIRAQALVVIQAFPDQRRALCLLPLCWPSRLCNSLGHHPGRSRIAFSVSVCHRECLHGITDKGSDVRATT